MGSERDGAHPVRAAVVDENELWPCRTSRRTDSRRSSSGGARVRVRLETYRVPGRGDIPLTPAPSWCSGVTCNAAQPGGSVQAKCREVRIIDRVNALGAMHLAQFVPTLT